MADDVLEALSRRLQDEFSLSLGPNTLQKISEGQTDVKLSGGEADDVARAALAVLAEQQAAAWSPPLRHGNHQPRNVYATDRDGEDVMVAVALTPQDAEKLIGLVNGAPEGLASGDLALVEAGELWASEQRGTQYSAKLRAAEERIAALDARHQPQTVQRWTPCAEHRGAHEILQRRCPMCAARPTTVCSGYTCGTFPCPDHLALHGETEETCSHG